MTLRLHYHPLSSFCWKVLIALYENDTPFQPVIVDLGDAATRTAFLEISPRGKMPVLEDDGRIVLETSVIIEYLDGRYPGPVRLIPKDFDAALACRTADRLYDLYVQGPLETVVFDTFRPEGAHDPHGVAEAVGKLKDVYAQLDRDLAGRNWAIGETFSMADCAAFPALFYADQIVPVAEHANVAAYLARLMARPSVRRVIADARPYFRNFPFYSSRMDAL
jgi:glutathione S-transferase